MGAWVLQRITQLLRRTFTIVHAWVLLRKTPATRAPFTHTISWALGAGLLTPPKLTLPKQLFHRRAAVNDLDRPADARHVFLGRVELQRMAKRLEQILHRHRP